LNSGVCALASPTNGVTRLARKPFYAIPTTPRWIGMPIVCTFFPATSSCRNRLVTTATLRM
jgi:hypothetical protein